MNVKTRKILCVCAREREREGECTLVLVSVVKNNKFLFSNVQKNPCSEMSNKVSMFQFVGLIVG